MASVAIIIGTYGDRGAWQPLVARAAASADEQSCPADVVVWEHADTLQHARNWGAGGCRDRDWLIFLDADDELDSRYVEEMLAAAAVSDVDILQPSTLGVQSDGQEDDSPVLIPRRDLAEANYLVIGSMCRASLFFNVGGFEDLPILEDWDLWQRMVLAGGRIGAAPAAVYRVHVGEGRNSNGETHRHVYNEIRGRYQDAWVGVPR